MSGIMDRLSAFGRGAAQGATGGWSDEAVGRILAAIPQDDGTGIPREYNGGQAEQYTTSERQSNDQAQSRFPMNFGAGQIAGAAPAALASGASVPAAVGLGALGGAGSADGGNMVKAALKGGALGGALGSAGKALPAAGAAIRDIPPPPPSLSPALAKSATNRLAQQPLSSKNQNMMFRTDAPAAAGSEASTSAALKSSPDEASVNQARRSVESDRWSNPPDYELEARRALNEAKFRPESGPLADVSSIPQPETLVARPQVRAEDGETFFAPERLRSPKLPKFDEEPATATIKPPRRKK